MPKLSSPSVSSPPPPPAEPLSESLQVTQQLLTELIQAAREGMVATRSHDDVLQGVDANSQLTNTPASTRSRKRKLGSENEFTSDRMAATKKRSTSKAVAVVVVNSDAKEYHVENSAEYSAPEQEQPATSISRDLIFNHSENAKSGMSKAGDRVSQGLDPKGHFIKSESAASGSDELVRRSCASGGTVQLGEVGLEISSNLDDAAVKSSATATQSKKSRKSTDTVNRSPVTMLPKPVKSSHRRFADSDLEALEAQASVSTETKTSAHLNAERVLDDNESSEDDAPEIVAASVGFDQARLAKAKAAKIAERHETARRAKRREHDERMKAQSRPEREINGKGDGEMLDGSIKRAESVQAKRRDSTKSFLPVTLPEDILTAAPLVRPPAPPSLIEISKAPTKKVILDPGPKPPKDIIVSGNTKIRFLQKHESFLPPKSSTASKSVREVWLTGQRGINSGGGVPRRKPSGGFIRRQM